MATNKTDTVACRLPIDAYNTVQAFANADGIKVSQWLRPVIEQAIYADSQRRLQIKVQVRRGRVIPHLYRYDSAKRLTDADIAALLPDGQICILALIPTPPTVRVPAKTIRRKGKGATNE